MLPEALLFGVSEDMFWTLTPRRFKIYADVYGRRLEQQDRFNWQLGAYFMCAVSTSLDHAFNGHKARSEYYEKPFCEMQDDNEYIDASNWTEEEKEQARMQLFGYLGDLQKSHEEAERKKKELVQ